jgi:hypothetical protein
LSRKAGEDFRRSGEALASAGCGDFELRGGKYAQSASVARVEMPLNGCSFGSGELAIDEGVELVRLKMSGGLS